MILTGIQIGKVDDSVVLSSTNVYGRTLVRFCNTRTSVEYLRRRAEPVRKALLTVQVRRCGRRLPAHRPGGGRDGALGWERDLGKV